MSVGFTISSICINGVDKPIVTTEDAAEVHAIIGTVLKSVSMQNAEFVKRPGRGRVIDYARQAALLLNREFTCYELGDKMQQLGWQTKSTDRRSRMNTVLYTIRKDSDFTSKWRGWWEYKPNLTSPDIS